LFQYFRELKVYLTSACSGAILDFHRMKFVLKQFSTLCKRRITFSRNSENGRKYLPYWQSIIELLFKELLMPVALIAAAYSVFPQIPREHMRYNTCPSEPLWKGRHDIFEETHSQRASEVG
jgi:hypothetical protein